MVIGILLMKLMLTHNCLKNDAERKPIFVCLLLGQAELKTPTSPISPVPILPVSFCGKGGADIKSISAKYWGSLR